MTLLRNKINDIESDIDLLLQKYAIEDTFVGYKCIIENGFLYASTKYSNPDWSQSYTPLITYSHYHHPQVTFFSPVITPNADYHLNLNGTLCLYAIPDYPLHTRMNIAREIIPWVYKWICFYELWLVNGNIWKAPFVPHHEYDAFYYTMTTARQQHTVYANML